MTDQERKRRLERRGAGGSVVSFKMSDDVRDAAQERARLERKSFSLYVEEAIRRELERRQN